MSQRFSNESDRNNNNNPNINRNSNEIPTLNLAQEASKYSIENVNKLPFARKKSRVMPDEIKINPKDLKGFAMEFETIYDHFERDPENFESQNNSSNLEKIGSNEIKHFTTRKSLNPFSSSKRNSLLSNGNDSFKKGSSSVFNLIAVDNDYANLKDENNEETDFFLKSRTNSILRILENNIEKKNSIDFSEK